ncbi:hypothetical protein T440DRAFT_105858 [Plenodomus tracheiphilus IPT5]|uniref:Uncharacterized protein n=1 Tax=Plenodomus tracheiphilus IPT5 TaxID=1408161 RepID=A0A6A7BME4_9PLEO|nr:hypothetical protein T440DRAFT_105858 [Plenodomus tracheiphilus IPT5]
MPSINRPLSFPEFRAHAYPFNTPDRDQITSARLRRHIPLDRPMTPASSRSRTPRNPLPTPIPNSTLDSTPTPPTKKFSHSLLTSLKSLSKTLVKSLRSCPFLRCCFPLSELSDSNSKTAQMLHAHWENRPPPSRHWTYATAERRPTSWVPRVRRRFAGDKTGRPIWVLEAEAEARAQAQAVGSQ